MANWPNGICTKDIKKFIPKVPQFGRTNLLTKMYHEYMINKVLPSIHEQFPASYHDRQNKRGIQIQQDGAKSNIAPDDPAWLATVEATGKHITIYNQPANSPDTNTNDLAFFQSIQLLYYTEFPSDEWQLIAAVQWAYDAYSVEKLNKMWLAHQTCMNEILKNNGGNYYDILHMNKNALMRENRLPLKIRVTKKAKRFD